MPKLKIGQYCDIMIRIKCAKFLSLFEIVNMGIILACEICQKITFLGPGPTLGPPYIVYSSDPSENNFNPDISW